MTNEELDFYEETALYLQGKLQGDTLRIFEEKLVADEAFAKEVAIHRTLFRLVKRNGPEAKSLRQTLTKIHNAEQAPERRRKFVLRVLGVTASFAFLLGLFWYLFPPDTKDDNNIFAKNIVHDPLSIGTRSAVDEVEMILLEVNFNQKKYQTFLQSCDLYLQKYPDDYDVFLAKAISELEMKQFEKALQTLDALEQGDVRINKAKWYKAMVYDRMGDREKCKLLLAEIVADRGYNFQEANKLLKQLESK